MSLCKISRLLCGVQFKFIASNPVVFSQCLRSQVLLKTPGAYFGTTGALRKDESKIGEVVIYEGPLSKQIRGVKLFSLLTSMSGVFAQPVILERANELQASTPAIVGICSVVGFFTFVTPLLLHYITKKYVTSVTYNSNTNEYTATTYSLFLRKINTTFKPGEPIVPDVPGMFMSMSVRGVPLFMDARFFDDVDHYKKIMGYDKPMDFKLSKVSDSS